jgi:hypothetical protein
MVSSSSSSRLGAAFGAALGLRSKRSVRDVIMMGESSGNPTIWEWARLTGAEPDSAVKTKPHGESISPCLT